MKRIAIFCDGTWNLTDQREAQTNVVQLAQAVRLEADDGTKQVPIYVRGVGTGIGSNPLARASDKIFGGAFGWGLERNVIEAYKSLIWMYEPGDEIYIFGFSRGAYTARSLAGLIRKAGILPRTRIDEVGKAMELYRKRGKAAHPDADKIQTKRADLSPDVATSLDDLKKRDKPTELLRIAYLGVWDTVGALGLPGFMGLFAEYVNQKYAFHDMELSSSVSAARHAVALDERRRHYPAATWTNLDTLNAQAQGLDAAYQQLWFAGDHGSIGGGGKDKGLPAITLGWVAEGAERQGLEMQPKNLDEAEGQENPGAALFKVSQAGLAALLRQPLLRDRDGPDRASDVHDSVVDRIRLGPDAKGGAYKPGSLGRVWQELQMRIGG